MTHTPSHWLKPHSYQRRIKIKPPVPLLQGTGYDGICQVRKFSANFTLKTPPRIDKIKALNQSNDNPVILTKNALSFFPLY